MAYDRLACAAQYDALEDYIRSQTNEKGQLMPVLQKAQELFGCLPEEVQRFIAEKLGVTLNEIYGVATFYSQFLLEPHGEHTISVCMGTACYVRGSQDVLDALAAQLKVAPGKTTPDMKFTLQATRCLGCCGLAPVITIGEDVYGRLTKEEIPEILAKYGAH